MLDRPHSQSGWLALTNMHWLWEMPIPPTSPLLFTRKTTTLISFSLAVLLDRLWLPAALRNWRTKEILTCQTQPHDRHMVVAILEEFISWPIIIGHFLCCMVVVTLDSANSIMKARKLEEGNDSSLGRE